MSTSSPSTYDVIIVGAGHGGAQAAIALRKEGFTGSVAIVGDEPWLPYERPALSKEYLAGAKPFDRLLIRPPSFWQERDIAFIGGERAIAVDADDRRLTLQSGRMLRYGAMIWATGGEPRRLSCEGHDLAGVHVVRRRADVDALIAALPDAQRVVIVGGGYIGLEAAAVLRTLGKAVTILEVEDRVLARVAGAPLSRFFEREHRDRGVDVRLETKVLAIEGGDGRASCVRLQGGECIPADLVLVGIGIVPAVDPLTIAGAAGSNGVSIDGYCRTSLPHVYAIGDCAAHANRYANGRTVRVESVQNASDQATVAAKAIIGSAVPYDAIPWFWSHQYDIKLQTVGLSIDSDEIVVRGDPDTRSFTLVYLRNDAVIALDCVNNTRDYVQGRRLVAESATIARARLADANVPLKDV